MRFIFVIALLLICTSGFSQSAPTRKVALIIGVKNYQYVAPLQNSLNDAQDMASTLKKKQFQVIELYDPKTKREMQDAVRKYFSVLNGQQEMAGLIFYSGHGMQVDGVNYLIPANANPQLKADLEDECLSMDYVMRAIEEAGNPLNIFILDACRNNPFRSFTRSGEKGLSMVSSPKGSYLVYATKPGSVASDGTGRNGLFTSMLLKHINEPDLNIEQVFKRVASDVAKESGDAQRPWIASDYTGDFYFTDVKPQAASTAVAVETQSQPVDQPTSQYNGQATKSAVIENATESGVYTIEGTNPNGTHYTGTCQIQKRDDGYFDVTWTTGGVVTKGVGGLDNGTLTVSYGDVYPAIYKVMNNGTKLNGTWANNTGKEILTLSENNINPFNPYAIIEGMYDVDGTFTDGSKYSGTVKLTKRSESAYDVVWNIAGSITNGKGKLLKNILTVDFGDSYPAIYTIVPGGVLQGTWANGSAKEVLTLSTSASIQPVQRNISNTFSQLGGTYSIDGTNPNGTRYIGTCTITKQGNGDYTFSWNTGGTVTTGIGKLTNNTMTVSYGDTYPAIYNVLDNGKKLDGTWGNGTGKEVLSK